MTAARRLQQLAALCTLLSDRDLARLRAAAGACAQTDARISALSQHVPLPTDPTLLAARQAHVAWARDQRVRLSQSLALQKATLSDTRAQAARSFARAQAVQSLAKVTK